MFIYVIVCSETLKLYIGQHKGLDLGKYLSKKWYDAHRYSDLRSHLYAAMRKHPRESWSIHPLLSDLQTREACDYWERLLIKALNVQHPDGGYNICDGGEGFTGPHTEEWKQKRRGQPGPWRGKQRPAETYVKAVATKMEKYGTVAPLGWNQDVGLIAKRVDTRKVKGNYTSRPPSRLGIRDSDDTKQKKRASQLGRKHTLESRAKMSLAAKMREDARRNTKQDFSFHK